jgi:acetyl-CoA synthetase
MSATSPPVSKTLSSLLASEGEYSPPAVVAAGARQKDYAEDYRRSIEDPAAFWGAYASRFEWSRAWDRVFDWDGVHHQWFVGAKTNITVNTLDRHARTPASPGPSSSATG